MIMGDGTWDLARHTIMIATLRYEQHEVLRLCALIKLKFNIQTSLSRVEWPRKNGPKGLGYNIVIDRGSLRRLISLIIPYTHPCYYYKFGPNIGDLIPCDLLSPKNTKYIRGSPTDSFLNINGICQSVDPSEAAAVAIQSKAALAEKKRLERAQRVSGSRRKKNKLKD